MSLTEMKSLACRKLRRFAECLENCRLNNLTDELETITSMLTQLFQLTNIDEALDALESAIVFCQDVDMREDLLAGQSFIKAEAEQGPIGRPTFVIPREILEFFLDNNFKVADIANLLGVSKRTIERRLKKNNLTVRGTYSTLTEIELEELVKAIIIEFPNVGYRTVKSLLMVKGHRVQENRIRYVLKNTDPCGVLFRRLFLSTCLVQRRSYSVRGPQALWHIDGNHKLIRWRIVIHGGIDGFSRMPVYLKVSNNNKAETVLSAFQEAVQNYGLPQRVRSDKGGENVLVADFMIGQRGVENKPFIAGRSVHNQRIERLWRELWNGVNGLFYNLFYHMEDQGILLSDSDLHIQILHLVYLPMIQQHLDRFSAAIQRRPLRTENNRSPLQLWLTGQIQDQHLESEVEISSYGVETEETGVVEIDSVSVPNTPLVPETLAVGLQQIIEQHSDSFRIDIFDKCIKYVQENS